MSSRALPEMEAEEAELLKAHQELHGNSSVNDNYVAVLSEIEEFNSLIDSLMQTKARAADLGLLHPKNPIRAEIAAPTSRTATAAISKLQSDMATSNKRPRQAQAGAQLQGEDLLLAAALRGEGLRS
eukprot:CAMPEP_0177616136 /NCGR_PEP_ID=MMETSP0419_2-20121207/23939_1 /TAXON_ID=582737 /ORGANISM="Tetraselmis sp., Strain GSL018" /LENGTH=126 /DNA_ID=CAMNT_0019114063 /DNA_START=1333 /DNA_END=1713 /DNA_ORIENTATION=+